MSYNSFQYPLRLAVKTRIEALLTAGSFPGLAASTPVRSRAVPSFVDFGISSSGKPFTWPGIVVSNANAEADSSVTNHSQNRGYSVLVTFADQLTSADVTDDVLESSAEDNRLAWRDILIDNLVPKGIVIASPSVKFHLSEYLGGQIVDWDQLAKTKRWVSSVLIRYWCRRQHVN